MTLLYVQGLIISETSHHKSNNSETFEDSTHFKASIKFFRRVKVVNNKK